MPFVFKDGSVPGVCKECGDKSWSPRSNKCEKHRAPTTSHKKRSAKLIDPAKGSVAQVVELAGAIDARTFSGKAPTAAEWEDKLTALVVLLTMTYVEYAVVKPLKLGEPRSTEATAHLGMTDEEARTIVEPCSYLLAKSQVNKTHGREAIEVLAFAPAALAILAWADRVSTFRAEIQRAMAAGEIPQVGGNDGSSRRDEAAPTSGGAPVANFPAGGVWDASEAPTSRVNGSSAHVDFEGRPIPA